MPVGIVSGLERHIPVWNDRHKPFSVVECDIKINGLFIADIIRSKADLICNIAVDRGCDRIQTLF